MHKRKRIPFDFFSFFSLCGSLCGFFSFLSSRVVAFTKEAKIVMRIISNLRKHIIASDNTLWTFRVLVENNLCEWAYSVHLETKKSSLQKEGSNRSTDTVKEVWSTTISTRLRKTLKMTTECIRGNTCGKRNQRILSTRKPEKKR